VDPGPELAEAAAYASLCESAGLPVLRLGGASCTAIPFLRDETMLNRVHALGVAGDVGDAELEQIEAFFRAHATRYGVSVSPLAPSGLEPRLRERGFAEGYAWMKFRRDVDAGTGPDTRLRVVEVADGVDFGRIVSAAYGMPAEVGPVFMHLPQVPGWSCFVAYDGDEPAGAAALFAHDGVGWLGVAGTRPAHRGKGAQGALLAARLRRAHGLGLAAATTETGERVEGRPAGSYRNILRAGFEESYLRPNLVSPAASANH
jgi:Acetyltransferase (GNAT) family